MSVSIISIKEVVNVYGNSSEHREQGIVHYNDVSFATITITKSESTK